MRIFAGVPREEASNDSGVVKDDNFASFSMAICLETLDRISKHIQDILYSPSTPFQ